MRTLRAFANVIWIYSAWMIALILCCWALSLDANDWHIGLVMFAGSAVGRLIESLDSSTKIK